MTAPKLIGTIAEKDGSICVQTAANCWFPLGGNSAIAEKFRESFNDPATHDIGRRLFMLGDVLQMENMEQMKARQLRQGIGAGSTAKKHLIAINAGTVTKSNVIGIRKAINHAERLRHGWSGNRSSVTPEEADAMEAALEEREPRVLGELHESGAKILRSPRWRRRFNEAQLAVIERLDHFALAGFDRLGPRGEYAVPVYRAKAITGQSFLFRNVPWQTADVLKVQSGPVVVGEFR